MPETVTIKVGLNRGRRRIWIDGKRLAAAGFVGGISYRLHAEPGRMRLSLSDLDLPSEAQRRKVTGRPTGKPIIDITGRTVEAFAAEITHVLVTFDVGVITITPAVRQD